MNDADDTKPITAHADRVVAAKKLAATFAGLSEAEQVDVLSAEEPPSEVLSIAGAWLGRLAAEEYEIRNEAARCMSFCAQVLRKKIKVKDYVG